MRAGVLVALALCLSTQLGCRGPEWHCYNQGSVPWRMCTTHPVEGLASFTKEKAHCFRNGPGHPFCAVTLEECQQWRGYVGAPGSCFAAGADEY